MFKNWEIRVCNYFVKNNIIPEENRELYEYGLAQGFVMLINFLVTLLLGILFNSIFQSLVFTAVYVPLRSYAGGYHAKTQGRCYIISIGLVIAVLLSIKTVLPVITLKLVIIISCITGSVIYFFSPIENENKPLNQKEKIKYKRYAEIIYLLDILVLFASYIAGIKLIAVSVLISLSAVVCMMVVELIKRITIRHKPDLKVANDRRY